MPFLATTDPLLGNLDASGGFHIWQSLGGLALVFGLLILSLKLLGRFNRRHSPGQTSLLTVWHLGPKREIQVLRLADEVHYIYRHEGAMVLLKKETWQQWQQYQAANPDQKPENVLSQVFKGRFSLAGLMGGARRRSQTSQAPARVGDLLQSLDS